MVNNSRKINELSPKKFQQALLKWFDTHGRKTLPWQYDKTPYRVWVSEIMLQQTQVSTVIPYFLRFMEHFPTIETLSAASEDTVLHFWTGLGYYSRARNLQRSAKKIMTDFQGIFPSDLDSLQSLPGIGRSTAGAILAIAFAQNAPILDGNVKRVLVRLHGITAWSGEKTVTEKLWTLAEKFTPTQRIGDYTQAIMDLGATLCVRGTPRCHECPLQNDCAAFQLGIAKTLPAKKPSVKIPTRAVTMLVFSNKQNHILLEKRPTTGVWGGLWSLPEMTSPAILSEIRNTCQQRFKLSIKTIKTGQPFRHTFSHYHLDITPVYISVLKPAGKIMEAGQQIWYNTQQPESIGLPAPVKNLIRELSTCPES
jgi:A/G-specific adenine glycosylase